MAQSYFDDSLLKFMRTSDQTFIERNQIRVYNWLFIFFFMDNKFIQENDN